VEFRTQVTVKKNTVGDKKKSKAQDKLKKRKYKKSPLSEHLVSNSGHKKNPGSLKNKSFGDDNIETESSSESDSAIYHFANSDQSDDMETPISSNGIQMHNENFANVKIDTLRQTYSNGGGHNHSLTDHPTSSSSLEESRLKDSVSPHHPPNHSLSNSDQMEPIVRQLPSKIARHVLVADSIRNESFQAQHTTELRIRTNSFAIPEDEKFQYNRVSIDSGLCTLTESFDHSPEMLMASRCRRNPIQE